MNRARAAQIFSKEKTFRWNAIQEIHLGKKGNIVRKLFERNVAVTWFITACQLGELTDKFRFDTEC